jgi:hypothetical protein
MSSKEDIFPICSNKYRDDDDVQRQKVRHTDRCNYVRVEKYKFFFFLFEVKSQKNG